MIVVVTLLQRLQCSLHGTWLSAGPVWRGVKPQSLLQTYCRIVSNWRLLTKVARFEWLQEVVVAEKVMDWFVVQSEGDRLLTRSVAGALSLAMQLAEIAAHMMVVLRSHAEQGLTSCASARARE